MKRGGCALSVAQRANCREEDACRKGGGMEAYFKMLASHIALGVEALAALVIAYGALEAVVNLFRRPDPDPRHPSRVQREVWL